MRVVRKTMTAIALAAALAFGAAAPASADSWVGGCNWTGTSGYGRGACVRATMGGKDYTNKTQWVGWVNAYRAGYGTTEVSKVEAWGDGFYFAAAGSNATWGAHRWVRSGTNVCGAVTYKSDGARFIACIAVRV